MDQVAPPSFSRVIFFSLVLVGKWLLPCQGSMYRQHYMLLDEERHRINYFEYLVQHTRVSETWEALPNKKEHIITQGLKYDTFFDGGMACKVKLHIDLLRFDLNDVVICLFKDEWEDDEVVEKLKVEINGELLDAKEFHGKVKPVTGYVLYKEASLVTGYIIDSNFYGQVRLLDKFRNHFVVFYIEPFSLGPLYDSKLTEQSIKDKATGSNSHANAILFEYVAHTEISSRSATRVKLPYVVNFTTPSVITSTTTPSTTTDENEPSSTTVKAGFGFHSTTKDPNFHSTTVGPDHHSTTIPRKLKAKGSHFRSSTMKPSHARSTTLDPAMRSFHMTTVKRNLIRTTVTPHPDPNAAMGPSMLGVEPESTTVRDIPIPIKSSTVTPHINSGTTPVGYKSTTVLPTPSTSTTTIPTTFKSTTVTPGPTTSASSTTPDANGDPTDPNDSDEDSATTDANSSDQTDANDQDSTDESQSQEQVPTSENKTPIGYLVYDIPENLLQQPNPSTFQQFPEQMLVGYIPYDVQANLYQSNVANVINNVDDENDSNVIDEEDDDNDDEENVAAAAAPTGNSGKSSSVLMNLDNSITNNIPINLNIIKVGPKNRTIREVHTKLSESSHQRRHLRRRKRWNVKPRPLARPTQLDVDRYDFKRVKRAVSKMKPKAHLAHVHYSMSTVMDDNDIIEELVYPKGPKMKGSVDVFDYMREDALLCKLCIWLQPEFANKFGFLHGEQYGAAEIVDIVRYLNWVFRPMDFSMDYKTDNVGFRAGHVIVSGVPEIDSITEAQWLDTQTQWGYVVMDALKNKFEPDCCVILAYIYKSMSPFGSLSFRRGMCMPDKNLAIVTGNFHGHKIAKFDVYRATAHALGHLMGALNDDDGDVDCHDENSVSYLNPFIMHATHQLNVGVRPNSMRMSFCARLKIAVFLGSSYTHCLVSRNGAYCGNGIVEPGEECDCGAPWQCVYGHQCCGMRDSFSPCKIIDKVPGENCDVPSIVDEPP
ncbi:unnamed protein product [Orchesella dallaii]|uniref:Peptidase M12B domain-containing protein n=1 Tax=Orchesella dallaii TaxID=48710 RepID=A0ABP1QHG1_9HEXA